MEVIRPEPVFWTPTLINLNKNNNYVILLEPDILQEETIMNYIIFVELITNICQGIPDKLIINEEFVNYKIQIEDNAKRS